MKFKHLITLTALSSSLLVSTVFAANTAVVTADGVNVRDEASTSSNIVYSLNNGDKFDITGINNGFFSLKNNDSTYFISSDFTKVSSADGVVTADGVFVRKAPTASAATSGMLSVDTPVKVVGQSGNWYQIEKDGALGFISKDYVTGAYISLVGDPIASLPSAESVANILATTTEYIRINANGGLNLRATASESGDKICVIPNGTTLEVLGTSADFTKVSYNGNTGYVKTSFTKEHDPNAPIPTSSAIGQDIVEWSKQYIGTPYVYGGTSLTGGVDCSGFTTAVFRDNPYQKVSLNRVASDQYNNGTRISKSELLPGDLVFFDTSGANNGAISHAGIYAGNGQFIHSSSGSTRGIVISDLNSGFYYNAYVGASRVLS